MGVSFPLVGYIFLAAIRDRLILSLLVLIIVGTSLSLFLGSAAVTEADFFALSYTAGGLRLIGVLALVLFICFYIRRAFDTKDIDLVLTRPISRPSFLISHSVAFMAIATLVTASIAFAVILISHHILNSGHILWLFSLWIELLIVVNAALFFAMVLPSSSSAALATFGLYVLSRLIGQVLGTAMGIDPEQFALDTDTDALAVLIQVISIFVPRLDLMGQSSWLIYGAEKSAYIFVFLQGAIYTTLLIIAGIIDLVRREF